MAAGSDASAPDPWKAFRVLPGQGSAPTDPARPWLDDPVTAPAPSAPRQASAASPTMRVYHVTAPDGSEYEVNAADDNAAIQALNHLSIRGPQTPAAPVADQWAAFRRPPAVASAPLRGPWDNDPVIAPPQSAPMRGPWDDDPVVDSVPVDVAKSAGSGVVRGSAELAMSPATLPKMAADAIVGSTEWLARKVLGLGPISPETQAARDQATKDMADRALVPAPGAAVDAVRAAEDATLHQPQTTAGKYAETIGEFVPSVLAGPGGLLRKAAEAAIPGALSEAAGEATQGTAAEPYARMAGGLVGNLAAVTPTLMRGAPDRLLAGAAPGVTPAQFAQAQALQARAAALGVPLSGAEAIQQITGGATKLGDVQRVVEGSTAGGAVTAPFYAQRPGQVATAAGNAFDRIAPAPASANLAGMAGQQAATGVMRAAEQHRTAQTTPLYDAAGNVRLAPDDMTQLLSDMDAAIGADRTGVTAGEIGRLRQMLVDQPAQPGTPGTPASRTPVLGPNGQPIRYESTPATPGTPGQPERPVLDIENVNRARKAMRERLDMPVAPGRDPITAEQQHAVGPFMDRLNAMMSDASPDFAAGNALYGQISDGTVNPIAAGPVGQISRTSDLGEQGRTLLPSAPAEGADIDARVATALLAQQDPQAAATIVRNRLGQQFAESTQNNMGGPNQWGGAKFAATIAGNPIQADALRAALGALPGREPAAQHFADLLEALQATGQRKPQGSATAFNQMMANELGHQSVPAAALQAAATGGVGIPALFSRIAEAGKLHALNRNSGRVAQVLLAPDSATQIGALAARGAESPLAAMFARQTLQSPSENR